MKRVLVPLAEGWARVISGIATRWLNLRREASLFRERILMATRELSDAQREVFLRVDLEQGDPRAVARTLGMREGTLRVTLHHARKRMAAALRRMEESPA